MRARVTMSAVSVTVLLAVVTACGSGPGGSGAAASGVPPAAPTSAPVDDGKVRLLEPGAEPREAPTYRAGKNSPISRAALSGESEPCTRFSPISSA